jgi:amino acid transporter
MENILNMLGLEIKDKKLEYKTMAIVEYVAFYLICIVLVVKNFSLLSRNDDDEPSSLNTLKWGGVAISIVISFLFAAFVNNSTGAQMNNILKEKDIEKIPREKIDSLESNAKLIKNLKIIFWIISLIPIIPIIIHYSKKRY